MERAREAGEELHILVIDDDEDMRTLFFRLLLPEGHQVFAAGSAEEGLALLPYDTFQVAFLDHHLPGMEGLVFGEYLRKNNPHMKIALVTGAPDASLTRGAEDLDIVLIPKPFRAAQLYALIDEYRRAADQRLQADLQAEDPAYELPLAEHFEALPQIFDVPNLPARVEERLVKEAKRSLAHLRSVSRYNERDRVVAYAALLSLQVLGVKVPRGSTGAPLTEEYDEVMRSRGRKPAFS
jgi:CheY-like chemotaxis protein